MRFKFLDHTADIKFIAYGKSLDELIENIAIAMFKSMYNGIVKKKIHKKIKVYGKDLENLIYNFLEELIFLMETENFFLSDLKAKVDIKNKEIVAKLTGDDLRNYRIDIEVKSITYNEMKVSKEKEKWSCQVVVDV
ncbi:MAG: archease [Candidatus Pacearchaeota archaeon]